MMIAYSLFSKEIVEKNIWQMIKCRQAGVQDIELTGDSYRLRIYFIGKYIFINGIRIKVCR